MKVSLFGNQSKDDFILIEVQLGVGIMSRDYDKLPASCSSKISLPV